MADVLPQFSGWPIEAGLLAGSSDTSYVVDGQNEAVACVFMMPETATITDVIFVNHSKTGTPADDSYTVSLQSVGTTGNPSGTILGGGSPASRTFPNATYPASGFGTTTGHVITLSNSISLSAGTFYALVIQKTGSTDASNYLTLRVGRQFATGGGGFPYLLTADTTPTWTKQTHGVIGFGIRSASKTYLYPTLSVANQAVGTTTEKGFAFTMPSGYSASGTYNVRGLIYIPGQNMTTGGTLTVNLYSNLTATNPTILQSVDVDTDYVANTGGARNYTVYFDEADLTELVPGTQYGIGFSHSSATGSGVLTSTLPDSSCLSAYPWGGYQYISRTLASAYPPDASDGAFTVTNTTMVFANLILSDYTPPSASGLALPVVRPV